MTCKYCDSGNVAEFSEHAKVWIHRLPKLDRRCLNQSPIEHVETLYMCKTCNKMFFADREPSQCPECGVVTII